MKTHRIYKSQDIHRIIHLQNAQLIRVSSAHKLNHEGICMRLDWQTDGAVWKWNGTQNGRKEGAEMQQELWKTTCSDTSC